MGIKKSVRIMAGLLILSCFLFDSVLANENDAAEFESHETKHFILHIENRENSITQPAEDIAASLENLWKILDERIGNYCVSEQNTISPYSIEKCNIYIYDNKMSYESKLTEVGYLRYIDCRGLLDHRNANIYICCRPSQVSLVLFHEVTHYYCVVTIPHFLHACPVWFSEMLAIHFSQYAWVDGKLIHKNFPLPFYVDSDIDYVLRRLKTISHKSTELQLIYMLNALLLNTFDNNAYVTEHARKNQSIYFVLGNYFLTERQDVVEEILKSINSHSFRDQQFNTAIFYNAFEIATKSNRITAKEIICWIEKRSPSWEVLNGDWYPENDGFAAKNTVGVMKLFCMTDSFPEVVIQSISSESDKKSRTGIVINGKDKNNYDILEVQSTGNIVLFCQRGGRWESQQNIGVIEIKRDDSKTNRDYSYRWQAKKQGNQATIHVNGKMIHSYQVEGKIEGFIGVFAQGEKVLVKTVASK